MQIEEPEKAFDELKKLADKYPSDARYPILIGDLYLQRNDTVKAYEYYQKAHGIDPSNPYYTVSMANYYEQVGDHEAAEKQIHTALINKDLDVSTKMGILARYIGQLQQSRNGTEAANALFQTLLEQHPEDTELKLHRSEVRKKGWFLWSGCCQQPGASRTCLYCRNCFRLCCS